MHRTDAHALAAILDTVNGIDQPTLEQRWSQALGTRRNSQEFAQRHAEVVGLLMGTMEQIAALPEDKRSRYEPYYMEWWRAVVSPEVAWSGQSKGSRILSTDHLSLLQGVGDVVEARMDRTPSSPGAFNLNRISELCADWLDALNELDSLPDAFRRSLIQSVSHLQWLIENSALFGVARVAKAASTVTGEVIQAFPHVKHEARQSWAKRLATWTATLVAFSAFNAASFDAVESTERLVEALNGAAEQVVDALEQADDVGDVSPPELK